MSTRPKKVKSGGNDGAGAEGGEEVFPDLHHKMSKKIAQLTKVIYHLNTKNEDHGSMIEAMGMQHGLEIEQLSRDAQTRMASQKEMAEMKQKLAVQSANMEKLVKKHNAEKLKTLADFEKFKISVQAREDTLASDWQLKCDQLGDDVEKMNKNFTEKLTAFEKARKDMNAALENALNSSGDAASDLLRKHEQEVAELVRASNQKYQDQMVQSLLNQENLKAEYEAKIAALQKEMDAFGQSRMEKELGQLRAKMAAEAQEALMKAKREAESALQTQREDLMSKLERVLSDIKTNKAACAVLEDENRMLRKQMDGELEALLAKHKEDISGAEQKMQNAAIDVAQLKQQVSNLQQDVSDAQDIIADRSREINVKDDTIKEREKVAEDLLNKLQRLQAEAQDAAQSGAAGQSALLAQLQSMRDDLATAEKINNVQTKAKELLEKTLSDAKDELTVFKISSLKTQKDLEEALQKERSEVAALKARLNDLGKQSSSETDTLMRELAALRGKLSAAESELSSQREKMTADHAAQVTYLEDKQQKDLDAMKGLNDALFEKNNEIGRDLEALKKANAQEIDVLLKEHVDTLDKMKAEAKDAESTLRLLLAQLENQLESLSSNADSEKKALKEDFLKSQERVKGLKLELDAKKKEGEGAQGVITGLKSQIESLRDELKASQKAFRDKMDMGLSKLEEDWQRKMDSLVEKHGQALLDAQDASEQAFAIERQALVAAHEDSLANQQDVAQAEAEKAAAELAFSEKEKVRALFLLKQEKDDRIIELRETEAKHKEAMDKLLAEHAAAMEELGMQLLGDASVKDTALRDRHAQEIAHLQAQAIKAAKDAQDAQMKALKQAADDAKKAETAALEAQIAKLNAHFKEVTIDINKKHAESMATVHKEHESATANLNQELMELKETHSALSQREVHLREEFDTEKNRAVKQALQDKMDLERLTRDNDLNIRNEKEAAQNALMQQQERFNADMRILKMEFTEDRARFEKALEEAQIEYNSLEEKYRNRESRPNDLARIQQLEYEAIEKDELVKTTREEMQYLKRELMNREESYNSKFNAKPNVGVMQVIKDPATKATTAKSVPPGAKSSKPTRVVQAQPGMGMGGMLGGVGVGIGGGSVPGIPGGSKAPAPLPSGSREGRR